MRCCLLPIAALLISCGPPPAGGEVQVAWQTDPSQPVDVVFVVDNTQSMGSLQASLGAAFATFREPLDSAGLAWQVAITTTDLDDPQWRGRLVDFGGSPILTPDTPDVDALFAAGVLVGTTGSAQERGLAAAELALGPPLILHDNEGLGQPGSRAAVVLVSDEDDCSDDGALAGFDSEACVQQPGALIDVDDMADRLRALTDDPEDLSLHALIEPSVAGEPVCGGTAPGVRYEAVAARTGGLVRPHCGILADRMADLGRAVAGYRTVFPLPSPADEDTIEVLADDGTEAVIPRSDQGAGWSLDPDGRTLRIEGDAPALAATVTIAYRTRLGSD